MEIFLWGVFFFVWDICRIFVLCISALLRIMETKLSEIISQLKYLSNLEHCQSAEDMQYALEKISEILEREFKEVPSNNESETI